VTYASVNFLFSDLYLQIPPFFPHTASRAAKWFFYVKNQAAGVCVNPSDAFFLPSNDLRAPANDFREPARDLREPADDFRASLNDFRGSLTVFVTPFRGKRCPQIILGRPQMICGSPQIAEGSPRIILGRPRIAEGRPRMKKRRPQPISGILRTESGRATSLQRTGAAAWYSPVQTVHAPSLQRQAWRQPHPSVQTRLATSLQPAGRDGRKETGAGRTCGCSRIK
jgi:hypothetical protein